MLLWVLVLRTQEFAQKICLRERLLFMNGLVSRDPHELTDSLYTVPVPAA